MLIISRSQNRNFQHRHFWCFHSYVQTRRNSKISTTNRFKSESFIIEIKLDIERKKLHVEKNCSKRQRLERDINVSMSRQRELKLNVNSKKQLSSFEFKFSQLKQWEHQFITQNRKQKQQKSNLNNKKQQLR